MRSGNFFISNKIRLNVSLFLTALAAFFIFTGMTKQESFNFYKQKNCKAEVSCQPSLKCDDVPDWSVFFYWERLWDTVDSLPLLFQKTIEAEAMPTKTVGGSVIGGWNIWSNGYIKETVNFPNSTIYEFEIIARGSVASGAWPNIELRIDEATKANFTVNKTTWDSYKSQVNVPSGLHDVIIAFTNDLKNSTEDRNLYVDKIVIQGDAP